MAMRPSSWAGRLERAPLKDPTGVRAAETMTMSLIGGLLNVFGGDQTSGRSHRASEDARIGNTAMQ
jgi:hypothetical protein